jgi:hypothetical protein
MTGSKAALAIEIGKALHNISDPEIVKRNKLELYRKIQTFFTKFIIEPKRKNTEITGTGELINVDLHDEILCQMYRRYNRGRY